MNIWQDKGMFQSQFLESSCITPSTRSILILEVKDTCGSKMASLQYTCISKASQVQSARIKTFTFPTGWEHAFLTEEQIKILSTGKVNFSLRKAPHRAYLELTVEGLSFCHYSFDSRAIMEFAPVLFPVSKSGSRTETMLHFRMQIQAKMRWATSFWLFLSSQVLKYWNT